MITTCLLGREQVWTIPPCGHTCAGIYYCMGEGGYTGLWSMIWALLCAYIVSASLGSQRNILLFLQQIAYSNQPFTFSSFYFLSKVSLNFWQKKNSKMIMGVLLVYGTFYFWFLWHFIPYRIELLQTFWEKLSKITSNQFLTFDIRHYRKRPKNIYYLTPI